VSESASPILQLPDDVARALKVPKKKVYALVHLGELEGVRVGGPRSLRIVASSVERFIQRNRVGA
jgi:excisionase family DNA binding protein